MPARHTDSPALIESAVGVSVLKAGPAPKISRPLRNSSTHQLEHAEPPTVAAVDQAVRLFRAEGLTRSETAALRCLEADAPAKERPSAPARSRPRLMLDFESNLSALDHPRPMYATDGVQ